MSTVSQTHPAPHPLAGRTVTINASINGVDGPHDFHLEDWNDRVLGQSWMFASYHPAAMAYAVRSGTAGLPADNEVVYGKVGSFGHLVHISEIQGGVA